jgi:hypothetical protein
VTRVDLTIDSLQITADALSSVQRPRLVAAMIRRQHAYEVRPRKDKRGVNLISDVLPLGVSNGGGVGFLYSCSPGGGVLASCLSGFL